MENGVQQREEDAVREPLGYQLWAGVTAHGHVALRYRAPCPCRKSDPTVFMMEPAEDGLCNDVTEPLDGAKKRRILV